MKTVSQNTREGRRSNTKMPANGMRTVLLKPSSPLRDSRSPFAPRFSFSESPMEECITATEFLVSRWNEDSSGFARVTSLFHYDRPEAALYVKTVRDLHSTMKIFIKEDPPSPDLIRAQRLIQAAVKRLQKEFYLILAMNRESLDPESISGRSSSRMSTVSNISEFDGEKIAEHEFEEASESITKVEQAASLAMGDLKDIADCMIALGYGKECVKIYKTIRKSIVDEGLYRLGVERLNASKLIKMDWRVLEMKIATWLRAVRPAVRVLFSGERILLDHVFSSSECIRESCFSDIARVGAIILLGFPELVASVKKTPEKVFRMLDLCEAIRELLPEMESIFSFETMADVPNKAITSIRKLGDSVRTMLQDLQEMIQKDTSTSAMLGSTVHPITGYVMNYLSLLADYSTILTHISVDWPSKTQSPLSASYMCTFTVDEGPAQSIALWIGLIVLALLRKLDDKAMLYREDRQSSIFRANNLHYVVDKIRESTLKKLLGFAWLEKYDSMVKEYESGHGSEYQRLV